MIRFIITLPLSVVALILVLPVLAVFVPLWIFNFMVTRVHLFLSRRGIEAEAILEFAPELGWKPRANLDAAYTDRVGDPCTVRTDGDGWPGRWSIEESDVIVFGDSFAFGYGSTINNAYYTNARECRIKPVGAQGYSMVPEVLLMERYAFRLKGKVLVWFICMENDLAQNLDAYMGELGYTTPFLRREPEQGEWEILSEHVQSDKWRYGEADGKLEMRFAHICTPCEYSARVFSAAEYLIRRAKVTCDAVGANLVVFSIPYKFQLSKPGVNRLKGHLRKEGKKESFDPGYPDKRIAEICDDSGVSFIRGTSHLTLEDYKIRDGHWNARGNKKMARVIECIWEENPCGKESLAAEEAAIKTNASVEKVQDVRSVHIA
ncbi:MAG: hypothetical protein WD490_00450 [Opitutales bacterium]